MHPRLTAAHAQWNGKRAGRLLPAWRDFDLPREAPDLWPWIIVTDVLRDPPDFRYRLIGTGVLARARYDRTGLLFSEQPETGPGNQVWTERVAVVMSRQPTLAMPIYTGGDRRVCGVSGLHLPLGDDGETVDTILTAIVFHMT